MRFAAAIAAIFSCCPFVPAYAATTAQQAFMDATTRSVEKYIAVPCETPQTAEIKVQLQSFADGHLKSIEIVQQSGYPQYDKAVLKAIADAQPLTVSDPAALQHLGDSILYFHPGIPPYPCNLQPLNGDIPNLKLNELPAAPKTKTR
ncbi:MAG TPA: TonB C-terminal domain-containing protein [Burkholderiales bacterium]|nr:TonB C-terminal domain-containing protein [Burkholderiales bacterium]